MPKTAGVQVQRRAYQRLSPEKKRAVAALAGRPPDQTEQIVANGHGIAIRTERHVYLAKKRVGELATFTGLPVTTVLPPNGSDTLVALFLGVFISGVLFFQPEMEYPWVGLLVSAAGIASHIDRARRSWKFERAWVTQGGPVATDSEPPTGIEQSPAGHVDVAAWARYALGQDDKSEDWALALVAIAAIHQAHARPHKGQLVLATLLKHQPGHPLGRSAIGASQRDTARLSEGPLGPVPDDILDGPYQLRRYVAIRRDKIQEWPQRCPLCNRPGTHRVTWKFKRKATDKRKPTPLLLLLLGGGFVSGLAAAGVETRTGTAQLWLCGQHRWTHRLAWLGVVLFPVLGISGAVWLPIHWIFALSLLLSTLFFWFFCLVRIDALATAQTSNAVLLLRGAHVDFVSSLPKVPPALLEP